MNLWKFLALVAYLGFATCHVAEKSDYESLATNLIRSANERMEKHWVKLRDLFLNSNKKFNQINHAPFIQETAANYRQFTTELAQNLSFIPIKKLKDANLKRQVKLLAKLQLTGLETEDYDKALNLLRIMKSLTTNKIVCGYYSEDCSTQVAHVPQILEIISKSRNPTELKYYWTQWRHASSDLARRSYVEYIYLFRKAAAYNEHVTPSRTWYLYYESDDFLKELQTAIEEMMPLYKEFHAYVRHILRRKYGADIIADDGPIPQHLMDQVIQHAWKAKSIFPPPHPERKLPDIKHRMDEEVFTPLKINEFAAIFFESMGLNGLSPSFWSKYARKMSDEEAGDDCKAEVYYFPPDVALKYCPKVDFKKFLQMHGHMAELQYNLYKGRLPFGLDREACPGFANAMGEAAIISAGSPRHLDKIHLISNYTLDNELSLNRLFRMGVHTIFTIPKYFVYEKFIADSLDHNITPNDLNCKFWELQDEFAGVSPPSQRTESDFDLGYKFFSGLDPSKPNTVRIVSELMGYQLYRALCLEAQQYVPGDPNYPLHNCDISDSKAAGELLIKMMSLGSTKHWRDVMEITTKSRKISAKPILEYYAPLYKWLKEQNELNDVEIGWDSADLCDAET